MNILIGILVAFAFFSSEPLMCSSEANSLYVRRSVVLFQEGKFKEAKELLELVNEKNEFAPIRHYVLGKIFRDKDFLDNQKAEENFRLAIEYSGSSQVVLTSKINLAYVLLRLEKEYYLGKNLVSREKCMNEALTISKELYEKAAEDDNVKSLRAVSINRRADREMWRLIENGTGSVDDFERISKDFAFALMLKPTYVGYAINVAKCFSTIAKINKSKGNLELACVYAKRGFELLGPFWGKYESWRKDGKLKAAFSLLRVNCPELVMPNE